LFDEPDRNFSSIASFKSNIVAVDTSILFANGMHSLLCLVGPSGWGKTHMLEAVATTIGRDQGVRPVIYSALEWVMQGMRSDTPGVLLLDNAQDAIEGGRMRQLFRLALERRVRAGRPTAIGFTAHRASRTLKSFLPSSRDWSVVNIPTPDSQERFLVLDQMARSERMRLSKTLTKVISHRMNGNGRTYAGALKRLKLYGSDWLDEQQVLRAFGMLDPFFVDNSHWDLGELVIRTAELPEFRKSKVNQQELALYTLLKSAELPEVRVASYFGIAANEVFHSAARFEKRLADVPETQDVRNAFVSRVIERINEDPV
jgi:hypothetical protein